MSRAAESFLIYDMILYMYIYMHDYMCIICVSFLHVSLDLFHHSVQLYSFYRKPSDSLETTWL